MVKNILITIVLSVVRISLYGQCSPLYGSPPTSNFFNTGTNGSGGILSGSSNDLNWKVAVNSINGQYNPAKVISTDVDGYYKSPWLDCTWISHTDAAGHDGDVDYFYKIDFNLPCNNLCHQSYNKEGSFCLNLDFFADNSVYEIYINDKPQIQNTGTKLYQHPGYTENNKVSIPLCKDWKAGNNSLIIHIVSGEPFAGFLAQASRIVPPPSPNEVELLICQGETLKFGNQNLTQKGNYTETFHPYAGCDSVVSLNLNVLQKSSSKFDTTICQSQLPFWGYNSAGLYVDKLVAKNGCDSIRTLNLSVFSSCEVSITAPNAFTPNNDGINDTFKIFTTGVLVNSMYIFNRWGELIKTSITPEWDGTTPKEICHPGTYFFTLYYTTLLDKVEKRYSGEIILIR